MRWYAFSDQTDSSVTDLNRRNGMLRGAISGFGAVAARAHLSGWQSRPAIKIVAVHDPFAARRHHAINLIKNIRVYDDLALMLEGEALDFVDIASPPAFHASAAKMALEAGISVIVEKPLCLTPDEFKELSAVASNNNRMLLCVHNWKYSPAYRRAYELIAAGRVGQVQYISFVRMRDAPAGINNGAAEAADQWRLDPPKGGGILIDHGWHCFYLASWLMGGAQPLSVSSWVGFNAHNGIDDFADVRVNFASDKVAHILLSWGAPVRRTSGLIRGTAGLLHMEANRLFLAERTGKVVDFSVPDEPEDSYHGSWFTNAAIDYERALNEGAEGFLARENRGEAANALRLLIAARQSGAHEGRVVSLISLNNGK